LAELVDCAVKNFDVSLMGQEFDNCVHSLVRFLSLRVGEVIAVHEHNVAVTVVLGPLATIVNDQPSSDWDFASLKLHRLSKLHGVAAVAELEHLLCVVMIC
jgi:hypothetical protein